MFLVNGIDILVVILVILIVLLVVFLRFVLPKIKAKKVGAKESDNSCHK